MNKELLEFLEATSVGYEKETAPLMQNSIPMGLKEFYANIKQADFPFGRIYSAKDAIQMSQRKPFEPMWFVFGQDNYSSFWLCRKEADDEGRQFTYWDHDAGIDIDEPVWVDLFEFLKKMEELSPKLDDEWDDDEWEVL